MRILYAYAEKPYFSTLTFLECVSVHMYAHTPLYSQVRGYRVSSSSDKSDGGML